MPTQGVLIPVLTQTLTTIYRTNNYVPSTLISTLQMVSKLVFTVILEVGIISPILLNVRKLRPRAVQKFTEGL